MTHTLRFLSPTFSYRPLGDDLPGSYAFERWQIIEQYEPSTAIRGSEVYGTYGLAIECGVSSYDDLAGSYAATVALSEGIERLWAFAAGVPLRHAGFGLFLTPLRPPPKWSDNHDNVNEALQKERGGLMIQSMGGGYRHWRSSAEFPLKHLIPCITAWRSADSITLELIALHYEAAMSSTRDGHFFLLAKALEIIRQLLPGRTDKHRQKGLPPSVQNLLTKDLHWFFDIANTRLNTRHPIARSLVPTLNPAMTGQETITFLRESEAIVRGIVCGRLGVGPVSVNY